MSLFLYKLYKSITVPVGGACVVVGLAVGSVVGMMWVLNGFGTFLGGVQTVKEQQTCKFSTQE